MPSLTLLSLLPELQVRIIDQLDLVSLKEFRSTCHYFDRCVSAQQIRNALLEWEVAWAKDYSALEKLVFDDIFLGDTGLPTKDDAEKAFCARWNIQQDRLYDRVTELTYHHICYCCLKAVRYEEFDSTQPSRGTRTDLTNVARLSRCCARCRLDSVQALQHGTPWLKTLRWGFVIRCKGCKVVEERRFRRRATAAEMRHLDLGLCPKCYERETGNSWPQGLSWGHQHERLLAALQSR